LAGTAAGSLNIPSRKKNATIPKFEKLFLAGQTHQVSSVLWKVGGCKPALENPESGRAEGGMEE
jgi:hypothetical protein